MRLKWLGILALAIDIVLAATRNKFGGTVTGDTIIFLILVFGIVLIMFDFERKEEEQC